MAFDLERLRELAKVSQARDEENAARELAQFESERLAAFSEWLNVELETKAGHGVRTAIVQFGSSFGAFGKPAINEPTSHEWPRLYAHVKGAGDSHFWIGAKELPLDRVEACVIELLQKAGIAATLADADVVVGGGVEISW